MRNLHDSVRAPATFLISLLSLSVSAQWQLIDDFQQWDIWMVTQDSSMLGWSTVEEQDSNAYLLWGDLYDTGNVSFCIDSYMYMEGISSGTVFATKALPGGGINPGETGTLFFRCTWDDFIGAWYIGTTDVDIAYDDVAGEPITPGTYGDFNALIWVGNDDEISHRDGDAYVSTNPPITLDQETWYNFWLVVENSWDNTTSPPTSTGQYSLYMQGPGIGDGRSPVLIPVGTNPAKDSAAFRRIPIDESGNPRPIKHLYLASNQGIARSGPSNRHYYDDFNYAAGVNLSIPPSVPDYQMFAGWMVDTRNRIWTGRDFLYTLNVYQAPLVWSYQLKSWIYLEESAVTENGAWVYFYK